MAFTFLQRQLLLVGLPIVALAGIGIIGLRRDRVAVETEARTRAWESAVRSLERFRREWERSATNGEIPQPELLRFDGRMRLVRPATRDPGPVPPEWVRRLSVEATLALDEFRQAEAKGDDGEIWTRAERWTSVATNLPVAGAIVELSRLRPGHAGTNEQTTALADLARRAFAERWQTDSGLPLGSVALARIEPGRLELRSAEGLLRAAVIEQPSALSPWLIERWERAGATPGIAHLAQLWRTEEELREFATRLRAGWGESPPATEAAWVRTPSGSWLVGHRVESSGIRVHAWKAAAIDEWTAGLMREMGATGVPAGCQTVLVLAGEAAAGESGVPGTTSVRSVMATAAGSVDLPDIGAKLPIRLNVVLLNPEALFAAQRRQETLFAGLLVCVVAVAGLGVWQGHVAFRREVRLNEEKSNFVSAVSHELRAPLATLQLLGEGLADGRGDDADKRREYAGFLLLETRRLSALVENVLDFARIEQGRKQYRFEELDLARLVAGTARLCRPAAEERGVEVRADVDASAGPCELWGDAGAIQQALLNLVDNALKHSPAGSMVQIRLGRGSDPERPFRIEVRDSGPGIPEEDQERIFERFYRRGSELRREQQGVGLGLAIVRHVVEGHGGRVRVESKPGEGALFMIELPARPPAMDAGGAA